ncbi:MAG TPA: alpha/beta hydrolase [Solirubrobacterales bacterium]|nr:alpha/beta hydrolase [Solirubrobacterales bacterium]
MAERIELEDVVLAYEERRASPEAATVVLVHGLGGSLHSWWAQLAACEARGIRAIAVDQRGAGLSSKPPGPYSVDSWACDLVRLIDALEVERPVLVGHSVGCMIAQHAGVTLGERMDGLVLIGGALRWRAEAAPVFEERVRLARAGRMDEIAAGVALTGLSEECRARDPVLHGLFRELIAANDPAAYAEWSAATAPAAMSEPERVRCPALALCGEHDPVTPPAFAEAVAAAVPDGRSDVVAGAAHWCQLEDPVAVNEAVLGFVAQISGPPGAIG